MTTVLITGGTGLIGTALTKVLLESNYRVIILTRNKEKAGRPFHANLSYAEWNIDDQTLDVSAITTCDYIVHLAGAGIADKRWTPKRKKEILESRTRGSSLLVKALKEHSNNLKAVISASGVDWYGPVSPDGKGTPERPFVETDPPAEDFLGVTCVEWEASIEPVASLGKRLVKLRTAFVLSNEGGALKKFRKPLKFGLATILGNGKQIMSWIHIDDIVRVYIYAIENETLSGVYNAAAPHHVANKKFVLQLARSMRGNFFIPIFVPSFVLEVVVGEVSVAALRSAAISCEKIKKEGYTFLYPSIQSAFHQLK